MLDPTDTFTLPLPVTAAVCLRFRSADSACKATLAPDLLGDWIVIEAWTAPPGKRGGSKRTVVTDAQAGIAVLEGIVKRRQQRGYALETA